uniref:BTB domain-containing protein n=1 Tax=Strongyloides papillosus TaxID=174720 RepID=A0A0N5CGP8_STREA
MADFFKNYGGVSNGGQKSGNSTGSIVMNDFNISYQWTISDFIEILHSRRLKLELESPSFCVLGYSDVFFKMYLVLHAESSVDTSRWGLFLKAFSTSSNEELNFSISHVFSLTSQTRDRLFWNSSSLEGVCYTEKSTGSHCGVESFITLETIKESLFSSGAINVVCEIMCKENAEGLICKSINNKEKESSTLNYKRYLSQHYLMFNSIIPRDCRISFGGVYYSIHKCLLMAHSLVFKERFMNPNSEESRRNCVYIRDKVGCEAFKMMIGYLYSAKVPNNSGNKNISELLFLAETYKINNLKLLCQEMLNFQGTPEITQCGTKRRISAISKLFQ